MIDGRQGGAHVGRDGSVKGLEAEVMPRCLLSDGSAVGCVGYREIHS